MKDGIINWNLDPVVFTIADAFPLRYYSVLFVLGLVLAFQVEKYIFKKERIPVENLEKLFVYVVVGIVLGARLGHCFFYEPSYYFQNPLEILLPIKKIGDAYEFIGFQGLASHGGTLGVLIALGVYCKKYKTNFLWVLDRIAIVAPIVGAFIRFGNFMNSEIYGKPTNGNWGVVFQQADLIPRHPTQFYEAFSYIVIFAILILIYKTVGVRKNANGLFIGLALILVFTSRFLIEFFKENQVAFESDMTLNLGQLLSIPFVIIGLLLVCIRKTEVYNNIKPEL